MKVPPLPDDERAAAELQWKSAFLEAQVHSSLDAIIVVDAQGKKILQNQRTVDLFKIPPHIADDQHDAEQLRWVGDMARNPEQFTAKVLHLYTHPGEISRDEIELKDGTILDRYSSPVVSKAGKYYGRIWTFRDITERKRAEVALRESEERFSGAFEYAPIGVALVAPDGRWLKVNRALSDLVGYSEAELLTRTFQDITAPADLAACLECVRQLTAGEIRAYQGEKHYVHKSGQVLPVSFCLSLVHDGQGRPLHLIAQIQDITGRKQAEAALLESKRFLRSALDALASHIAILDEHGTIIEINTAWNRFAAANHFMGGLRGVGDNYLKVCDSASGQFAAEAPAVAAGLRAIMAGQRDEFNLEYPCHSPKEKRWFIVRATRFGGDGPMRVVVAHENITERKQAERLVRQSEARYRSLIDNARDAIFTIAADGTFTSLNPAVETMGGLSRDEWLGKPFAAMVHPQDLPLAQEMFRRIMKGRPAPVHELRSSPSLKRPAIMEMTLSAQTDEGGNIIGLLGIGRDITGRKQAEATAAAFSKLGKELSSVASAGDAAGIISEAAHTVLAWDAFSIQLYSPETGIMTPLYDVDTFDGKRIPGPPRPAHQPSELQQHILQSGAQLISREPASAFLPGTVPFGDHARPSASLLFVPLRSQERPVGILTAQSYTANAYDQRDLRTLQTLADLCGGALERIRVNEALHQSEAQLFQSQKMETVGKLAGGIAHEFNSILTAIIGQSEMLLEDLPAGSPLGANANEILTAASRAATLTRQLLAYGRKQFLRPEILNLNQVMAGMDGVLGHLMGGEMVVVNIVPTAGLHWVKADAGQIEQVIVNLAMNARDAMPNGGQLTLKTTNITFGLEDVGHYPELKPGGYVMLAISDTGTGMSAEVKARVFEPFFSTKDVGQGTGLGLSTCYGIVKQSGGHISLDSELGRGTTFKIYLPQTEPPAKLPVPRLDAPAMPRGTETILLVETDHAMRELAAVLLRRLGYTVWTAANGVEALSLRNQPDTGRIDLLCTDVVLPHMSGNELADRVRALDPQTKILFTSAYAGHAIAPQGVPAHGVALLQKPFTPSALAGRLREVLDQPAVMEP